MNFLFVLFLHFSLSFILLQNISNATENISPSSFNIDFAFSMQTNVLSILVGILIGLINKNLESAIRGENWRIRESEHPATKVLISTNSQTEGTNLSLCILRLHAQTQTESSDCPGDPLAPPPLYIKSSLHPAISLPVYPP